MKNMLQTLFAPLLNLFEGSASAYQYKPSFRLILIAVGGLFLVLASGSVWAVVATAMWAGLLPGLVFLIAGVVCLVVGALGSDNAVARIWKSR